MFDTGEGEYVGPLAFPVRVGFGETLWTVGGSREDGTPKALIPLDVVGEWGVGMDTPYRGTHLIGVLRVTDLAHGGVVAGEAGLGMR